MKITEKQTHSKAYLNHRKFLLVIPFLVVPFVTMGFWALGGGKGEVEKKIEPVKGINSALPNADLSADSTLDKMAFYDLAQKDSLKKNREDERDPYYGTGLSLVPSMDSSLTKGPSIGGNSTVGDFSTGNGLSHTGSKYLNMSTYSGGAYNDPNERRVQEKLAALNASLNEAAKPKEIAPTQDSYRAKVGTGVNSGDIDRLESMMNTMQQSGVGGDPEMQQISTMLNQILDIQHPDRVQEKLKETSRKNQGQVFAVSSTAKKNAISNLDNKSGNSLIAQNGFFSINEPISETKDQNAIEAVIHENQTVTSGSIVKLRLINDIYINGQLIPRNTFVFGTANISGERLLIDVNGLRFGKSLFPVKLGVYDLDGLDGIYIPGAISRDVAKQSADQALQGLSMSGSLDPSLGVQAMGAGIEAAKSLMSKKVKLIKVTVKAGYNVLLKDDKQK
ncbi:conjugative transposon protein TraM [Pedobacter sp.]|jgi:conjugative transposon TraM protein|uniref:conjugative transposon protein TraM n=1 Tax=Pedobacter sp. TaxID=1411316 RepID=UPI002C4C6829|nr:conjugative transposon protein TraM [Pedobacter sp.]HWW43125.1 conjugative transposon protein TraM [Pedobacter sp.]